MAKEKDHKKDRVLVKRIPGGREVEYWREIADRFVAKGQAEIIKTVSRYKSPEELKAEAEAAKKEAEENKIAAAKKKTEKGKDKEKGEDPGAPGGATRDGGVLD